MTFWPPRHGLVAVVALLLMTLASPAAAEPPGRVLRVGFLSGAVSFRPAGADQWTSATANYPITTGDHLWTDSTGRAELQLGTTAIRLASNTSLSVLNLDDQVMQLRVTQGAVSLSVRELESDEAIEIDTPNAAISIASPGLYRFDASLAGDETSVTVRTGDADVATAAATVTLQAGQSARVTGLTAPAYTLRAALPPDEWEDWCAWRERRATNLDAERYVPRRMVGYEDLDGFGSWQLDPTWGIVWVPDVRPSWAPYRFGHWTWLEPWGWTWVDDASWGFAPFHYGRWASVRARWFWIPGLRAARPIYAPALVLFVGGPEWSLTLAMQEPVAWFPLGPREPFQPAYRVEREYLRGINRPHVDIDTFIDLGKVEWVNRLVPGAVTAVPGGVFVRGEFVGRWGAARIGVDVMRRAPIIGTRALLMPDAVSRSGQGQRRAPPPATAVDRSVVVRRPPPTQGPSTRHIDPPPAPPRDRGPAVRPPDRPAPAAPPVPSGPSPSPRRGDLAARQAAEQSRLEAEHAAAQARLRTRQEEDQRRAKDAGAREQVGQRQEAQRRAQDDQQKREHERTDARQEKQRDRAQPREKRK